MDVEQAMGMVNHPGSEDDDIIEAAGVLAAEVQRLREENDEATSEIISLQATLSIVSSAREGVSAENRRLRRICETAGILLVDEMDPRQDSR